LPSTPPGGTDVCPNPLLLAPDLPAAGASLSDLLTAPSLRPSRAAGLVTEVVGRHLWPTADPSDPVFTPDGESLELGGRAGGRFETDGFMAPRHAALVPTPEGVVVEDYGTERGVYLRAGARLPLRTGDRIRVGQQLLRFHVIDRPTDGTEIEPARAYWGRLAVMLDSRREAAAYPLRETMAEIGRDRGDVQFPFDETVGDPHCWIEVDPEDGPTLICDRDGPPVYVRIEHGEMVTYGSELLVGETLIALRRDDAMG
jgi:hypothetical protein